MLQKKEEGEQKPQAGKGLGLLGMQKSRGGCKKAHHEIRLNRGEEPNHAAHKEAFGDSRTKGKPFNDSEQVT